MFCYAKDYQSADEIEKSGFYRPDYNPTNSIRFDEIEVPSCWAILGYEEPIHRGYKNDKASEGLYIRHFTLPDDYKDKRVLLHFGGVFASAEVWLNGERLGRHDSGYTSFSFDITGKVRDGQDNTLALRVRQVYPGYKCDTYDDWTLGGIYRDVTIEAMPRRRWIDYVHTRYSVGSSQLTVKTMIGDDNKNTLPGNYQSPGIPYSLHYILTDENGNVVVDKMKEEPSHTASFLEHKMVFNIKDAHLWNAEKPHLYNLKVELLEQGVLAQCYEEKIGLREINIENGVFKINGVAVKLRGVNRHDEHPDVGRAVIHKHWLEDLQKMKAANINYVRASHYQHAKGFIELCDSIGMYVGEEVSLGGADKDMYDPAFTGPTMLRTLETVERDINNACIIYWSVGNEDAFTSLHLQAIKTIKGIDGTRPMLLPWNADDRLPEDVDILAPHYWTAAEYDSLAKHTSRPIISTEWIHAYGTQRFGGLQDVWDVVMTNPHLAGGAVWMWADQGLRTPKKKPSQDIEKNDEYLRVTPEGWDGINDSYRNPTRDLEEVKAVYFPVTLKKSSRAIDNLKLYNGYDFTNLSELVIAYKLFVNDKLIEHKENIRLDAAPHSFANLRINGDRLKVKEGETAYLQLFFTDKKGAALGKRSVELLVDPTITTARTSKPIKMSETPSSLTINTTKGTFIISKKTGLLSQYKEMSNLQPTVWHKLNEGDQIIKNRNLRNDESFEKYNVSVENISANQYKDSVVVTSKVNYAINDTNNIKASYITTVTSDGSMRVEYAITPELQTNYIPVVGLEVSTGSYPKRWFGLGPDEAFENKQSAEILGVWSAKNFYGTRQARWVEIGGTRILVNGYIDRDEPTSKTLRLLSRVLGRSEKGRLNDTRYRLENNKVYQGRVMIQ